MTVFSQALTGGPTDLVTSIYAATSWVLDAVYWLSLIGGVLLELRPDRPVESTTGPRWQPDPTGLDPLADAEGRRVTGHTAQVGRPAR
jgi:hypothetical protein